MPVKQRGNTFKESVDTPLNTIDISLIKADILAACIKEDCGAGKKEKHNWKKQNT